MSNDNKHYETNEIPVGDAVQQCCPVVARIKV